MFWLGRSSVPVGGPWYMVSTLSEPRSVWLSQAGTLGLWREGLGWPQAPAEHEVLKHPWLTVSLCDPVCTLHDWW